MQQDSLEETMILPAGPLNHLITAMANCGGYEAFGD